MNNKTLMLVVTNADLAGAPIHVRDLAIGLKKQFKKIIIVFGEEGVIQKVCSDQNIDTYIIPTMRSNINLLQDWKSLTTLSEIVINTRPDVIHVHSTKAGMISRIVAKMHKIPLVYTIHGWGFGTGRKMHVSIFVRWIEFALKMLTTRYIAVSNHDRDIGISVLNISPSKISTIHNGISNKLDNTQFKEPNSLIMVARDDPQKDYDTLFRAIAGMNVTLYCVGKGTDSDQFKARARNMVGTTYPNLKFLGVRDDIPVLIDRAAIFVLSSRFEGLPISIIEAMRSGMPIVASDVGGVNELLTDGFNGWLFESGNYVQLRTCINKYLNENALLGIHGSNSRQKFLQEFESEKMLSNILNIYETVLGK